MNGERTVSWPGWEVARDIGSGSYGTVYEIRRNNFGNWEHAALKVIHLPRDKKDLDELYSDGYDDEGVTMLLQQHLEEIYREYSLMYQMKGNTNIVCCDDFHYNQNPDGVGWEIYIKMELLTPLLQYLSGEITEEQTTRLGMDMCNALSLCKSRNIIHRDIKPQNIFVSQDGNFKLGDFGIAKTVERTTGGTRTGTYRYMAPEVYFSRPYGHQADIYSLGLVMYWMLNERKAPFLPLNNRVPNATAVSEADSRRFRGEPLPAPAHGSRELQRIVLKACAFDPAWRYRDAEELREDLEASTAGPRIYMPPQPQRMPPQPQRTPPPDIATKAPRSSPKQEPAPSAPSKNFWSRGGNL